MDYVGGWGLYQFLLLLACLPFAVTMAYTALTPVLVLYTPEHRCKPSPGGSDMIDLPDFDFDPRCQMYSPEEQKVVKCQHGWDYNMTGLFESAVTDV